MIEEDNNLLNNFGYYENEKPALEKPNIEEDNIDQTKKSLDTKNHVKNLLSRCTTQDGLLRSELLSSLKEVRFIDQKFATGIPISNIKYIYLQF